MKWWDQMPWSSFSDVLCLILLFHTKMTLQFVHCCNSTQNFHLFPDKAQTLLLAWRVFPSGAWCAFPLPTPGRSHLVPWLLTRLASYLPTLLGEAFERPMHQKILWLCDYPWKNSCNYPWKIDVLMYSMCKLNKQGDNIQPWLTHFPIWNQSIIPHLVLTVASWPAYRFFRRQVRCPGIPTSLGIVYSLLWSTQSKALA